MSARIAPSPQMKLFLSVSHEFNGFACKMEATDGMIPFSKFSILASILGRCFPFGVIQEKIDL